MRYTGKYIYVFFFAEPSQDYSYIIFSLAMLEKLHRSGVQLAIRLQSLGIMGTQLAIRNRSNI